MLEADITRGVGGGGPENLGDRNSGETDGVNGVTGEGGCMKRPPHRVQWVAPDGLLLIPVPAVRGPPSRPLRRGW